MTTKRTNAERQAAYRKRKRDSGLVQVSVYVPAQKAENVKYFLKKKESGKWENLDS